MKVVQQWDAFVRNPRNDKSYGLLNLGAEGDAKANAFNTVASLTGRALADILSLGADAEW